VTYTALLVSLDWPACIGYLKGKRTGGKGALRDKSIFLAEQLNPLSRATHAHPTSPRSIGFCAIWDCISLRLSSIRTKTKKHSPDSGSSLQAELSATSPVNWQSNRAFCWYLQGHALAGGCQYRPISHPQPHQELGQASTSTGAVPVIAMAFSARRTAGCCLLPAAALLALSGPRSGLRSPGCSVFLKRRHAFSPV